MASKSMKLGTPMEPASENLITLKQQVREADLDRSKMVSEEWVMN